MEKIVLFGAGKYLNSIIKILEKLKRFKVIEIWDNDSGKTGKPYKIGEDEVVVTRPHASSNVPIIITSSIYSHELRNQLLNDYYYKQECVKSTDYLFHYLKEEILIKYKDSEDVEIQDILTYLNRNELSVFNYTFCNEYSDVNIKLEYDSICDMYYTEWKGHRMFLPQSLGNEGSIKAYIKNILIEQDKRSPHCYESFDLSISSQDVLVDAGAAEGFFTLERVDNVKKAYLIESDPNWVRALNMTFSPYEDRVCIVNKVLGNHCDDVTITLDSINEKEKITYLKMDIEGAEFSALQGARSTLLNDELRAVLCTYHTSDGANLINGVLRNYGFDTSFSKGYMFYPYGDEAVIKAELRRGLLFVAKQRIFRYGSKDGSNT